MVVVDIGAEVHGYSADVTPTIPVSGTYSPEQLAIYELVYRAQEAGIHLVGGGASADRRGCGVDAGDVLRGSRTPGGDHLGTLGPLGGMAWELDVEADVHDVSVGDSVLFAFHL